MLVRLKAQVRWVACGGRTRLAWRAGDLRGLLMPLLLTEKQAADPKAVRL
jgi:hypothetical protein